jgi:hypothetical protein
MKASSARGLGWLSRSARQSSARRRYKREQVRDFGEGVIPCGDFTGGWRSMERERGHAARCSLAMTTGADDSGQGRFGEFGADAGEGTGLRGRGLAVV